MGKKSKKVKSKKTTKPSSEYSLYFNNPKTAVDAICKGCPPTNSVLRIGDSNSDIIYREGLIREGLISSLLVTLNKCDEGFSCKYEGYDFTPRDWICCLCNIVAVRSTFVPGIDDIRMEISLGIEPLVKCMCNDVRRQLFQSEKLWYECIECFLDLIRCLVYPHSRAREAVDVLMAYDGLLELVIQSLFWKTHRADVMPGFIGVRQMRTHSEYDDVYSAIQQQSKNIMDNITLAVDDGLEGTSVSYFCGEGKELIKRIALIPIVSKYFDDNCITQFIVGLFNMIEASDFEDIPDDMKVWYFDHVGTIGIAGVVDKVVITRMMGVGDLSLLTNCYEIAVCFVKVTFNMLCPRTGTFTDGVGHHVIEDDNRFAYAIKRGLIQKCLRLLERFKDHDPNTVLMDRLLNLLDSVKNVALQEKSSKAIGSQQNELVEKVELLELLIPIGACNDVLQMAKASISIASVTSKGSSNETKTETCAHCCVELENDNVLQCANCKRSSYCSRKCQVSDWKYGRHKHYCRNYREGADKVLEEGGTEKDVKKQMTLFANVGKAGRSFICSKTPEVFIQAMLKNCDILKCVVVADISQVPHTLEVKLLEEDFYEDYCKTQQREVDQTKKLVDNYIANGELVCAIKSSTVSVLTSIGNSANSDSWAVLKDRYETMFRSTVDKMSEIIEDAGASPQMIATTAEMCATMLRSCYDEDGIKKELQDIDFRHTEFG